MVAEVSQSHFSNNDTWSGYYWKNPQRHRANLTSKWLPESVESVLDAGCGNGMLTRVLRSRFHTVGVDLSYAALRSLNQPKCQANLISLPFESGQFDAVVVTEVIEHLGHSTCESALSEIARVSKKLILISVPYCEDLENSHIICPQCQCRFHRDYHVRRFERKECESLFANWKNIKPLRIQPVSPIRRLAIGSLVKTSREARRQLGVRHHYFPKNRTCPQCGYTQIGQPNTKQKTSSQSSRPSRWSPKSIVARKLWPRYDSYRWWLALYAKND